MREVEAVKFGMTDKIERSMIVTDRGVNAVLGYNRMAGITWPEYNRWLQDVHYPDLLANPHLVEIVLHEVLTPVHDGTTYERLAELRFDSLGAYNDFTAWRASHPVAPARRPDSWTDFQFYLLCKSTGYANPGPKG